jgi:TolA-binding protein
MRYLIIILFLSLNAYAGTSEPPSGREFQFLVDLVKDQTATIQQMNKEFQDFREKRITLLEDTNSKVRQLEIRVGEIEEELKDKEFSSRTLQGRLIDALLTIIGTLIVLGLGYAFRHIKWNGRNDPFRSPREKR